MTEVTAINIEIMRLLGNGDSMTPGQIIAKLPGYDKKDIKYSIRRLREKSLIQVVPNLLDMRRVFYRLASSSELKDLSRIKEIELKVFNELASTNHGSRTTLEEMEAAVES